MRAISKLRITDVSVFIRSVVSNSVILWTVACQAPLSKGFFRQEYWSRLPSPTPGDLPNPGIKPTSLVSPAPSSVCACSVTSVVSNSVQPYRL